VQAVHKLAAFTVARRLRCSRHLIFLDFNLTWLRSDNFWDALVILNKARHAHLLVSVFGFRVSTISSNT
jgi:hypothetical protein